MPTFHCRLCSASFPFYPLDPRPDPVDGEFQCAMCGQNFEPAPFSDVIATQRMRKMYGEDIPLERRAVVCGDCAPIVGHFETEHADVLPFGPTR